MTRCLSIALAIVLASCTTAPTQIRTIEVQVPVAVPCPAHLPEPVYSDTDAALLAAPNIFERVKLLLAGREERAAQDQMERAARTACEGQ
ncbi:hypothetical protein ACFPIF_15575 [Brevundimonas faecalis]|uniref:hypothetical protein n=1 Tax=Brevundimonas faecalis TaxID=947378 RepID=UPI0036208300